jgi:hypothetical protein
MSRSISAPRWPTNLATGECAPRRALDAIVENS